MSIIAEGILLLMRTAPGLAACALSVFVLAAPIASNSAPGQQQPPPATAPAVYICPMHPDVTQATPGTCHRCGMVLIAMDPFDAREYRVDVTTTPPGVPAGRPFNLRLTVREPTSGSVVRDFATVHDKRFHLFVVSQDLEHYAHVHPEQGPDGSWGLEVRLPKPGYYKLYSDFLPMGGTPQVIALPLVTAGAPGDLASSSAHLVPDRELTKAFGDMRVRLVLPDDPLVAGREEAFALYLTDRRTGEPVSDIEPYLAAWGHSLLISEDTLAVVHAHPVEFVPENDPSARGGPVLTFRALFPKAGNYRLWTQIQRKGEIVTAMYTVRVESVVSQ